MALYSIVLLVALASQVDAYSTGAATHTCFTQYPKHKYNFAQTGTPSFDVTFSPSVYIPGQEIKIKVKSWMDKPFRGIQMIPFRSKGNKQEIVGRFVGLPVDKMHAYNCFGGYQNMATHKNSDKVTKLAFKWKAPVDCVGDVTFKTTFVRDFQTFWHQVEHPLKVHSGYPVVASRIPAIPLSNSLAPVDFDECGKTKGCFFHPNSGDECKVAVTFQHRPATNDFKFELYSNNPDDQYISLAFSDDLCMGDDPTMTCTGGDSAEYSVQEGYNPGRYNERNMNRYSSSHKVKHKDGKLHCSFVLPETFLNYHVIQDPTAENLTFSTWDLTCDRYLQLSWGPVYPDTSVIRKHHDTAVTPVKVDLKDCVIVESSDFPGLVQAHASLMMIAWIVFASLAIVISRFYRQWMPTTTVFGQPLWLPLHAGMALLVKLFTLIGLIVVFAHYGSGIREESTPHSLVGLAVTGALGLQVLAGILRPGPDHKMRPIFNWGHRLLGLATVILAAATMFLAFEIDYIYADIRKAGVIILSMWVAVVVTWYAVFEFLKCRWQADPSDDYCMEKNGLQPSDKENLPPRHLYTVLLILYSICLVALCIMGILAFLGILV